MSITTARALALLAAWVVACPALAIDLAEMYPDSKAMEKAQRAVRDGDMEAAVKHYMSAAEYGNKEAQKLVGLSYLDGSGVKQDNVQACAWLKLASTLENGRVLSAYSDLMSKISEDDRKAAEKAYSKLAKSYGDEAALKKRKKWVRREYRDMSGSGARRPPPNMRVQVSLSPGRSQTVTMGELQEALDGYVDAFETELEKADG